RKAKIGTAQAGGVPAVATTLAAEGRHLEGGRDVLLAASAAQFAEAIVRLYCDAVLWTSISEAALANVTRHFSPAAAENVLQQLLALADSKKEHRSNRMVTRADD